jgi:hypothetical protein
MPPKPASLEKELETYRRELPKYIDQSGKYLLIRDSEVLGVWSSYEDAIQEGYKTCGLNRFLVKKIEPFEYAYFNSRTAEQACQP